MRRYPSVIVGDLLVSYPRSDEQEAALSDRDLAIIKRAADGPKTKLHDLFLLADVNVGRVTRAAIDSLERAWSWSGLPGKDPETIGELLSRIPLDKVVEIAASHHPRGQTRRVRAAIVEVLRACGYEFEITVNITAR